MLWYCAGMSHFYFFGYSLKISFYFFLLLFAKIYCIILDLLLPYIMPDGNIFIWTKLTEAFTAKYPATYIFMNYVVKILENRLTVGGWTPFQIFFKDWLQSLWEDFPSLWSTYFSGQLIWIATNFPEFFRQNFFWKK